LKLKKHHKLVVAADGSAASGKTTGAKRISKKYGLKFLSSGLLYRYASYQLIKHKPKNKISFLKKVFKNLSLKNLKIKPYIILKFQLTLQLLQKSKKLETY
jgi:Cytidylate kinase